MIFCSNNDTLIIGDLNDGYGRNSTLFLITYSTSVLSASFGIAKFLKSGPCRLIPNEGFLSGYCQIGFLMVMLNTLCCIVIKGILLSLACAPWITMDQTKIRTETINLKTFVVWFGLNYLPQLIFVSLILVTAVGIKRTSFIVWNFPTVMLTPLYSYWCIGPVRPYKNLSTSQSGMISIVYKSDKFVVSLPHVWFNIVISSLGLILNYIVFYGFSPLLHIENEVALSHLNQFQNSRIIKFIYLEHKNHKILLVLTIFWVGSVLPIMILQCSNLCNLVCCLCYRSNCLPLLKLTILDSNNINQIVDAQSLKDTFEPVHSKLETKSVCIQTEAIMTNADCQTDVIYQKDVHIQAVPDSQTVGSQISPNLRSVELQATPDPVLTQDCGIMVCPENENVAIQVLPVHRSVQTQTK